MIFAQAYLCVMNIYPVPLEFIYLLYYTRLDQSVAFKCAVSMKVALGIYIEFFEIAFLDFYGEESRG